MQLDSDITSCMGGASRTNRSYFLLLRVIIATLLFLYFGLKTIDRSELPVRVLREHFKLLNSVRIGFCDFFHKKGSVMTKFTIKKSLFYWLGNNVYIGEYTQIYSVPNLFFFFSLYPDVNIT